MYMMWAGACTPQAKTSRVAAYPEPRTCTPHPHHHSRHAQHDSPRGPGAACRTGRDGHRCRSHLHVAAWRRECVPCACRRCVTDAQPAQSPSMASWRLRHLFSSHPVTLRASQTDTAAVLRTRPGAQGLLSFARGRMAPILPGSKTRWEPLSPCLVLPDPAPAAQRATVPVCLSVAPFLFFWIPRVPSPCIAALFVMSCHCRNAVRKKRKKRKRIIRLSKQLYRNKCRTGRRIPSATGRGVPVVTAEAHRARWWRRRDRVAVLLDAADRRRRAVVG